jgi:hypothetical protein
MTIEKQFSAFFSSATSQGSIKTNSLGNRFAVQLNTPLSVPSSSVYASLEVVSAKVWNSSPNISVVIGNNRLYFNYQGNAYDVVLPDGLYGIDEMNLFMDIYFSGDAVLPNDLFSFEENGATQKLSIKFNYIGITIDFTMPNALIDVTGFYTTHDEPSDRFTSTMVITSAIAGESIVAPNEARFNRVVNYYITSNLLSDGIPINNRSSGVICEVPINVRAGSLINFVPTNPLRADCSDLIGQTKQLISFALVDQLSREVSTSGEEWSLAIVIRYHN